MNFPSFALLGLALVAPTYGADLRLLTEYNDAKCLDGTAGAYYVSRGKAEDKWIIYFEGGGWCYNEKDCANRALTDLGSSKAYSATMDRNDWVQGITTDDCDTNPTFCEYNLVYLKYCDGNSFSGNRDTTVAVDDQTLHFKGHGILDAVLTDLFATETIKDATDVLLTGCSAGGLSAYLHSDYVGSWFKDTTKYGVAPVSGMFQMQRSNVNDEPVMPLQMQSIYALSNATSGVHQGCVADLGSSWLCNIAPTVYNYIESDIFVIDSSIDSWQNGCIRTASYVDQTAPTRDVPNGLCSTEPGWEDCGGDPSQCSSEQMYAITEYQSSFIRTMTNAATYWKAGNGAFVYECSTHCSGINGDYAKFEMHGVKMNEAVGAWWEGGTKSNNYLPQLWGLDSTNPNESC